MLKPDRLLSILVVHSSAELYGSDRSLLDFVRHSANTIKITVALPENGVLVDELVNAGATVLVGEVCKIQRGMLSPGGMLRTLLAALRALRFLGGAHRENNFDIVYSNTVAVLGGALCARWWRVPHVWHVREILEGSNSLTKGFRHLVAAFSSTVVCNSGQTRDWIKLKGGVDKYLVIWNGFDVPVIEIDRMAERTLLGISDNVVLFVLVGRVNAWKGQKLLVDAFSGLVAGTNKAAHLLIVGSAPTGQEHFERELAMVVENSGCKERITLLPYRSDIEPIWVASDVVVVPSTEPEPFGRVAIEAMGFSRPVIAAAHGGLVEIVVDGETGRLVAPRDVDALTAGMHEMLEDVELRHRMGKAGHARQLSLFSVNGYASKLIEVMRSTLAMSGRPNI